MLRRYLLSLAVVTLAFSLALAAFGEELKLSATNTKINFVGTKADGKHDGGFKTITGAAKFAAADLAKTQLSITVDTNSLWSDDPKLTNHLKSADFFNVREHKAASFVSTAVKAGQEKGTYTITGDLTLLGVKKSISVPAKIAVTGKDFSLSTYFPIKRSEFGMTYGAGKVDDEVNITATIKGAP
jgi:polyisoprenoid-binding protein YceI